MSMKGILVFFLAVMLVPMGVAESANDITAVEGESNDKTTESKTGETYRRYSIERIAVDRIDHGGTEISVFYRGEHGPVQLQTIDEGVSLKFENTVLSDWVAKQFELPGFVSNISNIDIRETGIGHTYGYIGVRSGRVNPCKEGRCARAYNTARYPNLSAG